MKTNPKRRDATKKATIISPVHFLEKVKREYVFWMLLQPMSIRKLATMIPMTKLVRLSMSPLRDFFSEMRKQIKGTSRVTKR